MDGTQSQNPSMSPPDLRGMLDSGNPPQIVDVRRRDIFEASPGLVPGSRWCDMDAMPDWFGTLDKDRPVVVVCLHGHERSHETTARLRAAGFDACWLEGGFTGWVEQGGALESKPAGGAE